MTHKTLVLTLVAVSLVVAASSAALNFYPTQWSANEAPLKTATPVASMTAEQAAPVSPISGATAPNYRAIVQQAGPAVVGVTVAGLHRADPDEPAIDPNDPFFRFFRGLPGFQWRGPGHRCRGAAH